MVEKELRKEGVSRQELGREAFVERVWEWREQYGARIIEQFKRLGASCDYATSASRSTRATSGPSIASSRLYEKG